MTLEKCLTCVTPQAVWVSIAGDGDWSTGVGLHTGVSPDAQMRMKQGLARLQKGQDTPEEGKPSS